MNTLDPFPSCPLCLGTLQNYDERQFQCEDCGERIALCEIWNWAEDNRACGICNTETKGLGTISLFFHDEKTTMRIDYAICLECSKKNTDTLRSKILEDKTIKKILASDEIKIGIIPGCKRVQEDAPEGIRIW